MIKFLKKETKKEELHYKTGVHKDDEEETEEIYERTIQAS